MRDDWQRYAIAIAIIIAIILIVAFASLAARYWFRWVRCPACRTTPAVDLRVLDRHGDVAVTSFMPELWSRFAI